MTTSRKPTGCYICLNCPNHLINQRFGYVIPCKEKSNCKEYIAYLTDIRTSNKLESEAKALNFVSYHKKRK